MSPPLPLLQQMEPRLPETSALVGYVYAIDMRGSILFPSIFIFVIAGYRSGFWLGSGQIDRGEKEKAPPSHYARLSASFV